jgi:adenylylsulfate reductase subunit B
MVVIDTQRCDGCGSRPTTVCEDICPGSLYRRGTDGKTELRDPNACWDCCACVKVCPRAALTLQLPFQIAEAGHRLLARRDGDAMRFQILDRDGTELASVSVPVRCGSSSESV